MVVKFIYVVVFLPPMSRRSRRTKKVKPNFFRAGYLIPATVAIGVGIAAVIVATNVNDSTDVHVPTATPVTHESQLESVIQEEIITYGRAKQDESLRQAYLNQIFANRDEYGDEEWNSFAGLVYDPEFKLHDSEFERRGIDPKAKRLEGYSEEAGFIGLMRVLYFGEKGVPLAVHVSKHTFEVTKLEDDIFAILDNESVNAHILHKERVHLPLNIPRDREMSDYMFTLISEVLSFEKEFYNIETGKRDVSQDFLRGVFNPARAVYKQLEQAAAMNNDDALFARGVLEAISLRPTLKYFK